MIMHMWEECMELYEKINKLYNIIEEQRDYIIKLEKELKKLKDKNIK